MSLATHTIMRSSQPLSGFQVGLGIYVAFGNGISIGHGNEAVVESICFRVMIMQGLILFGLLSLPQYAKPGMVILSVKVHLGIPPFCCVAATLCARNALKLFRIT